MEYRGVRETAENWGISMRLVQRLCSAGRIEGAKKLGNSWLIPTTVQKPFDPRKSALGDAGDEQGPSSAADKSAPKEKSVTSSDEASVSVSPYSTLFAGLMPLMNSTFAPGECQQAIERFDDPGMRAVAQAEYYYFSGQAENAAHAAGKLLDSDDPAVRFSAYFIYAYANLPLGNINGTRFALSELRLSLQREHSASASQTRAVEAFASYAAAVLLHLPVPEGLPSAEAFLPLLPAGVKEFTMYVHAHRLYLQGSYERSLGVVETVLTLHSALRPIPAIYLHLVAVMNCMSLKQVAMAREHLLAAWEIARPDNLIQPFGEHHGLLGGMLESVIKKGWPEDFNRIIDITYRFSAGWRRVHNPAMEETVADNLSTTEFAVSMLAARGWTNQEIGAHLDISSNTVKSYLASSFRKLGINRRKDLGRFMLR